MFRLLDGISVESDRLVNLVPAKYRNKLLPEGYRFIDFQRFSSSVPPSKRKGVIGYIGRLSEEKGVLDFLESIPVVTKANANRDLEFLVVGEGALVRAVRERVDRLSQQKIKVVAMGWIPESALPHTLRSLKILVFPSRHAEGLPTIILEAMASGTPVLATKVGAIDDIVEDGVTGYVLEGGAPDSIARGIRRILEDPNLDIVTEEARRAVISKYSFAQAVERYRRILALEYVHPSA